MPLISLLKIITIFIVGDIEQGLYLLIVCLSDLYYIAFSTLVLMRLNAYKTIIPRLGKYLFPACNKWSNIDQLKHVSKTRNNQSLSFKQFSNNPAKKRPVFL